MSFIIDPKNANNIQNIQGVAGNSAQIESKVAEKSSQPIAMVKKLTKEEMAVKLGISIDALESLTIKNPDFINMNFEQQQKIINNLTPEQKQVIFAGDKNAPIVTSEKALEGLHKHKTPEEVMLETRKEAQHVKETELDKRSFSRMNLNEKADACAEQSAKIKFLYDNNQKKDIAEWNNLSKQEREALIKSEQGILFSKGEKNSKLFSAGASEIFLDDLMTKMKTAESMSISMKKFEGLSEIQQREYVYDYLFVQVEMDKGKGVDSLSDLDKAKFEKEKFLIDVVSYVASKKAGKEVNNFCPGDADKFLKDNKISKQEAIYTYYNDKQLRGEVLTRDQKRQLRCASLIVNSKAGQQVQDEVDIKNEIPQLTKNITTSEYGNAFANAKDSTQKAVIIDTYIRRAHGKGKEYHKAAFQYIKDAKTNGDLELADLLIELVSKTKEGQNKLARSGDRFIQASNANNMSRIGQEAGTFVDNVQSIVQDDPKFVEALHLDIQQSSTVDQMSAISSVQSKSGIKSVELGLTDMAVRSKNADVQTQITNDVAANSGEEAKIYNARNVFAYEKEAQMPAAKTLEALKNEEVTLTLSENTSKMHKDVQVEYEKFLHKASYDYSEKVAKTMQANLANDIQNCHKDNQLAMHKDISTSKYSEIVETAAKNIANYDSSVQAKALDATYATGNDKAIEAAVSQISKLSPEAQRSEAVTVIVKNAIDNSTQEDKTKLLNSLSLSNSELDKLSPSEKKEYYKRIFDKASPVEKMQMLSKLPGGQQKTVYTMICRFFPEILSSMVESGKGKMMLNSGLPVDATNKVLTAMKHSTNIEVITQLKEIQNDNTYKAYFEVDKKVSNKNTSDKKDLVFQNPFITPVRIKNADETILYKKDKRNMDLRV